MEGVSGSIPLPPTTINQALLSCRRAIELITLPRRLMEGTKITTRTLPLNAPALKREAEEGWGTDLQNEEAAP